MKLLTAKEVGEQLQVRARTVAGLGIPVVEVGRLLRYKQEDVDAYIARRTRYGGQNGSREKKKKGNLGLSVLPSREMLQKLRLSNSGGGKGSGNSIPS